jgi:hypothetical protein
MMRILRLADMFRHPWAPAIATAVLLVANGAAAQSRTPTFARDIAPIFQEKCQSCHRPGEVAPMSLITYEDARPWARAIKTRVQAREMPPWYLDKSVGIQTYKNDLSLSDEQTKTIIDWVDSGAQMGNPKDLPAPRTWPSGDLWQLADRFGPPDLIVKSTPWTMPARSQDQWWRPVVETGLREDRWVRAVEIRPSPKGRRIVHHAIVEVTDRGRDLVQGEYAFAEFSLGAYGEAYIENTGKLLKASSKMAFEIHYHAVGEEITDQVQVGLYFYPRGVTPKHEVVHVPIGLTGIQGREGSAGIDIPPNSVVRLDAFMVLQKPAIILNFKPHMHVRGKAMSMEAVLPDGRVKMLSYVDHYDFNWQQSYVYTDDAAPILPRGTMIHVVSWHDNTSANKNNPDPNQWVGTGPRTIDEMTHAHTNMIYLDEGDYQQMLRDKGSRTASRGN